ncbi:MAG: hypothetical protein LUF68_02630, partial [Clostridiales bacterium]|nr:hypothetical protein [Clostridiales bacterium]
MGGQFLFGHAKQGVRCDQVDEVVFQAQVLDIVARLQGVEPNALEQLIPISAQISKVNHDYNRYLF